LRSKGRPPHGTGDCGGSALVLLICLTAEVHKRCSAQLESVSDLVRAGASRRGEQAGAHVRPLGRAVPASQRLGCRTCQPRLTSSSGIDPDVAGLRSPVQQVLVATGRSSGCRTWSAAARSDTVMLRSSLRSPVPRPARSRPPATLVEASRERASGSPALWPRALPARERNFWLVLPFSITGAADGPGADDSGGAEHKNWPPAESFRGGTGARRGGSGARVTHDTERRSAPDDDMARLVQGWPSNRRGRPPADVLTG